MSKQQAACSSDLNTSPDRSFSFWATAKEPATCETVLDLKPSRSHELLPDIHPGCILS